MNVIKRSGKVVEFDGNKITDAIHKAFMACRAMVHPDELTCLTDMVINSLPHKNPVHIEVIQDTVERALMLQYPEVAKAYILYRQRRAELRGVNPDPSAIADYIHASKYARYVSNLHRRELFDETVDRVAAMHCGKFLGLSNKINQMFELVYEKKVLPSMRSMQFAGSPIFEHNARMYNCCYTLIDRPKVFGEILYLLLCGSGVGYSVQRQHVAKLPKLSRMNNTKVCHISIEDTIEGWSDALVSLIRGAIHGYHVEFSYERIRPIGSPLKSGGRAPGHIASKRAIEYIRSVLLGAQGRHLRPIECYDIICFSAEAVLSGGIRRSSSIALFSYDDDEMRYSKDPAHFDFIKINPQRALANNSVAFLRSSVTKEQFMSIMDQNRESFGEPGFVFLSNLDHGTNPCGEIGLDPTFGDKTGFGFCNLVEINVAALEDQEEFYEACEVASFIATLQASYTDFKYLSETSQLIAKRDALIGVGLTGMMDNPWIFDPEILKDGRHIVKITNEHYARVIGINPAKRCTCVKPSGTASLELGCVGSGIHPHHAKRYFRRVTANPHEPVAKYFKSLNSHMVEVKPNGDWCLTFPVLTNGITLDKIDQGEFLNKVLMVVENWIQRDQPSHNVSTTMVVTDWSILENIWTHRDSITSMTFLPAMSDKDIPYCPREAVITDKDMTLWNELLRRYVKVDYSKLTEQSDGTAIQYEAACGSGSCEIGVYVDLPNGFRIFEGKKLVGEKIGRFYIIEANDNYSVGVWS